MSKPLATKGSTPLSEKIKLGPISHFLSPVSCDSLMLLSLRVWMWSRCVKFGIITLTLILVTGSSTWHLMAKNSWGSEIRVVALHKDGVGYKKIAKTLKMICSTVIIQWFNRRGSTQNRPRHDRPKKLSARAQRHIQRLCLGNRDMTAASIAAEVEGGGGGGGSACQCSDHTPHTASNWTAWLSFQKEASSKDDAQ